ncbi:phosphoribosylformylglycinamidine synthase [Fulvivirgaceae bacterium PWU4]|uniref:Phosphoribosylformylglycinamidine synthase n=1 Tax=Chryseosolibacter histidini TaxID=2782349 RepID=A0AAP2DQE8_9BACT|nr:phosphoribosylformylglycinamidine synthase [Chryseosolibacter histidini]MBT1699332.1 phosphoribosylformylglycinamidine synthase [Chryseosolibacter histidini]
MILFFRSKANKIYAVGSVQPLQKSDNEKLIWLLGGAEPLAEKTLSGYFVGPRKEMITPWSTNAVEITQTMGIRGIQRIEEFDVVTDANARHDKMLQVVYKTLDQDIFTIHHTPEPILEIDNIAAYNEKQGLALSGEEISYLENVSKELGRKLTDSEVFGFSQVNSEHCRHKIFNGTFIINGKEKPFTLFQLIKKTSKEHPNQLVSAYKDNVAFIKGPVIEQFAPVRQDIADYFKVQEIDSVISIKAETHNFPTTVEPFNGAATGSGGEIRDRLAGGKGALPLAGTAVYMTSYPRLEDGRKWEKKFEARPWLYQTPEEILIKASDGASDFGNKFGQPLICGSVLTFEHFENDKQYGFDKVIMLAGGIGYGKANDSQKGHLQPGDKIVLLGGDNYRIGMGGGAVSSVATGEYGNAIELNAIQRSNPEMQKRVMNAIRAMVETDQNLIITIHDHGAGGHLNCLSELLEETGGKIDLDKLPVGDPTLSDKEIISNESQERMGLGIAAKDVDTLKKISERERAPFYVIGEATGSQTLEFVRNGNVRKPVDLKVNHLFGSSPKTIISDTAQPSSYKPVQYDPARISEYLEQVLQLEAVACKDWLTNKVDRSVTGRVATQQTCGPVQLPLNNVGVMALDFLGKKGIATAIGHAPGAALIDPVAGSKLAIAEALTNVVWAPLSHGLKGVSLSANWMWPSKNKGEDARLYDAVEAVSDFAIKLGINIPTGKDSLSMTQKYRDGKVVYAPGTVIISAAGEVEDITKTISPALQPVKGSKLIYIDLSRDEFKLGGSSFAQVLNLLGNEAPTIKDEAYFAKAFGALQQLIKQGNILAGHDISEGGLVTVLLEMCFSVPGIGLNVSIKDLGNDSVKALFSENPGVVIQVASESAVASVLGNAQVSYKVIGELTHERTVKVTSHNGDMTFDVDALRDTWFKTSYLLDSKQRPHEYALARYNNYKKQVLEYNFQPRFDGRFQTYNIDPRRRKPTGIKAAIIREKGVNGDREMAFALYLAGFDVKDVHMTDLVSGREDLSDLNMIVFVGGFSNSDVLGSAKGWAGAFLYNPKAKEALDKFYQRQDTLTLGVCNGCQLMMELGLLYPEWKDHPRMHHNASGRFESIFVNLTIPENDTVMFKSLAGANLGAWVAHGEGRFSLPEDQSRYRIAAQYFYKQYPGTPGGADFSVAALSSKDGRHLAIMPHIERSLFPWNWGYYPVNRKSDEISPWMEAFVNARDWIKARL